MPGGRPPGRKLDAGAVQLVAQEVVPLAARGRISIPAAVATGVPWLGLPRTKRPALAVLAEPGKITLHSWEQESPAVLEKRRQLIEDEDYETLRLLEDRYRQMHILADLRLTLGLSEVVHLGLSYETDSYVYIFRKQNVFELVSPSYRDRQLAQTGDIFPDLP